VKEVNLGGEKEPTKGVKTTAGQQGLKGFKEWQWVSGDEELSDLPERGREKVGRMLMRAKKAEKIYTDG